MKKSIPALTFTFLVPALLFSQQVPNGNFENWTTTTLYEEPDGYTTTNNWSYTTTANGNALKVADSYHGNFAVKLSTVSNSTDTIFGGLFIGTPQQGGIKGGMPYTGMPDSVSGYAHYSIQPGDTSFFIVGFKKAGVLVAVAYKYFTGTQATYKRFSVPTSIAVPPDSLVVLITSSRLDGKKIPGSTITLDSLTLTRAAQQLPNPSFESWAPVTSEEPDNWSTVNFGMLPGGTPSCTKTTDSQNGTYALKIESVTMSWGDTVGLITNGYFGPNGPAGGMYVLSNPAKISGYYKYFPVGPDTALAAIFSYSGGILLDSSLKQLTAQNSYTYFEVPLMYNSWPMIDTLNILFASGNILDSTNFKGLGSILYIDNLSITYNPVSTGGEIRLTSGNLYPNPFSDEALVSISSTPGEEYSLLICDVLGKMILREEKAVSFPARLKKENLLPGMYLLAIRRNSTGEMIMREKFMVR